MAQTTKSLSKLVLSIEQLIESARLYRSCITCEHFDEKVEGCALAGMTRPPARVIAMGCDQFKEVPPF